MGATEAPSTGATWTFQEFGFTNGQATGDTAGHVLVWTKGACALEHRMSPEPHVFCPAFSSYFPVPVNVLPTYRRLSGMRCSPRVTFKSILLNIGSAQAASRCTQRA